MVKVLIAYSGGGKTAKIKTDIINHYYGDDEIGRDVYIIEREDYSEYSRVFNLDYFKIIKPSSDMSFFDDVRDSDIYIDCECMEDEFMSNVLGIIKNAKTRKNNVVITFLDIERSKYQRAIFEYADEVLVGKCDLLTEQILEAIFSQKIRPQQTRYEFRKLGGKK